LRCDDDYVCPFFLSFSIEGLYGWDLFDVSDGVIFGVSFDGTWLLVRKEGGAFVRERERSIEREQPFFGSRLRKMLTVRVELQCKGRYNNMNQSMTTFYVFEISFYITPNA